MHVVVIGEEGSLRSQNLSLLLSKGYEMTFSPPVYPEDGHRGLNEDVPLQSAILGRPLTRGEVGCWVAHHETRRAIAIQACHDFHLILEDDADIGILPNSDVLMKLINEPLGGKSPAILNLYQKGRVIHSGEMAVNRVLAPNAGTVGYVLNQEAAKIELDVTEVRNTADWPSQYFKCRFFESRNFGVLEWPTTSIVGVRGAKLSSLHFYFTAIRRMISATTLGVSAREALWSTLLAPLVRDIRNRMPRKF